MKSTSTYRHTAPATFSTLSAERTQSGKIRVLLSRMTDGVTVHAEELYTAEEARLLVSEITKALLS